MSEPKELPPHDPFKCKTCGTPVKGEVHMCPYQEVVNENDALCNCCVECMQECIDAI